MQLSLNEGTGATVGCQGSGKGDRAGRGSGPYLSGSESGQALRWGWLSRVEFSTRGILYPRGHLAIFEDISGFHNGVGVGCSWHLVSQGRGCHYTSYNA